MRHTRLLCLAIAGTWLAVEPARGQADRELQPASIPPSSRPYRDKLNRDQADPAPSSGQFGWWIGPAGIAAALAVFGGVSLAQKRFLPGRDSGPLQVVGRASLSPRQSVYLVRVGGRVLILGSGPQGPPSALGEITDAAELARLAPRRPARPSPPVAAPANVSVPLRPNSTGFDRRIGDDDE